jgi:hypothetical protein
LCLVFQHPVHGSQSSVALERGGEGEEGAEARIPLLQLNNLRGSEGARERERARPTRNRMR